MRRTVLFPGYLFVHADLEQGVLSRIKSTPGVVRLVGFDGEPQAVPQGVVEALRERVDGINATGGVLPRSFKSGEVVSIRSGRLRGLEAVFIGSMKGGARVRVLLELLGRLNEVQVDVDEIEHANVVPGLPMPTEPRVEDRQRRTRGHGRTIKRLHVRES